jgi:hypothetical protein
LNAKHRYRDMVFGCLGNVQQHAWHITCLVSSRESCAGYKSASYSKFLFFFFFKKYKQIATTSSPTSRRSNATRCSADPCRLRVLASRCHCLGRSPHRRRSLGRACVVVHQQQQQQQQSSA